MKTQSNDEGSNRKRGGWNTFPFVTASSFIIWGINTGVTANLIVYMKQKFGFDAIDATIIVGIVSGTAYFSPVIGALVADSRIGCVPVISFSSAAFLLSMIFFTLTAAIPSLSPLPFSPATNYQLAILYTAMALLVIGVGGTRYVGATIGAVQFDTTEDRSSFFSWYSTGLYTSLILGLLGIVYVQDNAGWVWGFSFCTALTGIGLLVFLFGTRYYRYPERVKNCEEEVELEKQALLTSSSSPHQGNLKTILKLVPIISSMIFMSVITTSQVSFTILQALSMNRAITRTISVPASSMPVFLAVPVAIFIPILNRAIYPLFPRITPLHRIGCGLLLASTAMAVAGFIEYSRLSSVEPVSVFFLLPALLLVGLAEAFLFPAQLEFYYQEFPDSLKGTATGVNALTAGAGGYLGTAIIALVRSITSWLQDGADESRLDYVYWLLAVLGMVDFCYFLVCSKLYTKNKIFN